MDSDRIAEVNQAWEHLTQAREKIEHMQNADQLNPQTIALLGSKLRKSNERYRDATADMDTSKLSSGLPQQVLQNLPIHMWKKLQDATLTSKVRHNIIMVITAAVMLAC